MVRAAPGETGRQPVARLVHGRIAPAPRVRVGLAVPVARADRERALVVVVPVESGLPAGVRRATGCPGADPLQDREGRSDRAHRGSGRPARPPLLLRHDPDPSG